MNIYVAEPRLLLYPQTVDCSKASNAPRSSSPPTAASVTGAIFPVPAILPRQLCDTPSVAHLSDTPGQSPGIC